MSKIVDIKKKLEIKIIVMESPDGIELQHFVNGRSPVPSDQSAFMKMVEGIRAIVGAFFLTSSAMVQIGYMTAVEEVNAEGD